MNTSRSPRNGIRINLVAALSASAACGVVFLLGLLLFGTNLHPLAAAPNTTPPTPTLSAVGIAPSATQFVFPTELATPTATPAVIEAVATSAPGGAALTITGQVSSEGSGLRLRQFPGTAGTVIEFLDVFTPLIIIGRTPDNAWVQVVPPDGRTGWVQTQYLTLHGVLDGVPVTGAALGATETPAATNAPGGVDARVSAEGDQLRLRSSPGTAGPIQLNLAAGTALDLVGRTSDNAWVEVNTFDDHHGWVMARYLEINIEVNTLPVTGQATDAAAVVVTPYQSPAAGLAIDPARFVSGITGRAREIYLAGQALGNRADTFSKVGDSITDAPQFFTPIGLNNYNLEEYGYLGPVVQFYSNHIVRTGVSFSNISLSAKGGWQTGWVTSTAYGDKSICGPDETPLACEYRLSQPAVALILLGTNDVAKTPMETYRSNLRRVIEYSIDHGVIPVLTTLPPFQIACCYGAEQGNNDVIRALSREYSIPLLDYWAALQSLPNHGISDDGVHPSLAPNPADFTPDNLRYGYAMRNLTALQVLDMIWRQVMY